MPPLDATRSRSSTPIPSGSTHILRKRNLPPCYEGDPVEIKLMSYRQIVRGKVGSVARGINVSNAQPNQQGLATVNPIFPWVRLAQRVPVHIGIDQVPEGVRLVGGMTATVQVDARPERTSN